MPSKKKYYVVWGGTRPGIYEDWESCSQAVQGVKGARCKSYSSLEQARQAMIMEDQEIPLQVREQAARDLRPKTDPTHLPNGVERNAIAVDAACSGNPGQMEYRGVYLGSGQEIFHFGPVFGTNNIGEFLAIVHCLALQKQKGTALTIYSDSINAMKWIRQKKCRTTLVRDERTKDLYDLIERGEKWLRDNAITVPILKWETQLWGEIPADFGRK